jgi:hypothetical protein
MPNHSCGREGLRGTALKRFFACGSMVLTILSVVRFFALRAKKRTTKDDTVPLRMITFGPPRKSCSYERREQ